jgi:hypothetical protein
MSDRYDVCLRPGFSLQRRIVVQCDLVRRQDKVMEFMSGSPQNNSLTLDLMVPIEAIASVQKIKPPPEPLLWHHPPRFKARKKRRKPKRGRK